MVTGSGFGGADFLLFDFFLAGLKAWMPHTQAHPHACIHVSAEPRVARKHAASHSHVRRGWGSTSASAGAGSDADLALDRLQAGVELAQSLGKGAKRIHSDWFDEDTNETGDGREKETTVSGVGCDATWVCDLAKIEKIHQIITSLLRLSLHIVVEVDVRTRGECTSLHKLGTLRGGGDRVDKLPLRAMSSC